MKRVGFLTDDNGNKSAVRLMSFLSLFSSIFFATYGLFSSNKDTQSTGTNLSLIFLTAAYSGKVGQKYIEMQNEQSTSPNSPRPTNPIRNNPNN